MWYPQISRRTAFAPIALAIVTLFSVSTGFCEETKVATPEYATEKSMKEEADLGAAAAKEFASEKSTKFIDDASQTARVQKMGEAISKIATTRIVPAGWGSPALAKFAYTFKIVDDKDVNAFSLPGGYIYVNKGLLDYVQSDDELAGVIAHEIAHVAHHHSIQLQKVQNKQLLLTALTLLGSAAAGVKGEDLSGVAYVASLVTTARVNGYGQTAEYDADKSAVVYMMDAGYNPVGMLTFMERLARDESRSEQVEYGIYATHPPSTNRANRITDQLEKAGVAINRRQVTTYMAVAVQAVANSPAYSISISNTEIMRVADSDGQSASARANDIAEKLRSAMLGGANLHNVRMSADHTSVIAAGKTVIVPTTADAALAGTSVQVVTESALKALQRAIYNEALQTGY